jgi:hypothetical protein
VQRPQRRAGRERHVDGVPDPADVLEVQEGRVVEVHLALRDALDEQQPAARPGQVGDELGEPAPHALVDGAPAGAPSRQAAIGYAAHYRAAGAVSPG